ncbi:hypothetical protein EHS25_001258 [Saitozyma podzolica]|uniref:Prenylcysteine lyase domain-containing protein n=1 Tax=Saitozyma podzolica TaxID=1890683 RepID=A0A427YHU3_9TREE|nr:hypothetical protein EHS25_001258 [Saitozyma podzolica]
MVLDGLRQRAADSGRSRLAIVVVLFLSLTLLLSQPFHFRSSGYFPPTVEAEELQYPVSSHDGAINQLRPKRIAIVGAGASGSATAFFLRRAARVMAERIGVPEEKLVGDIVVFDKEGYIGGRSTTVHPHGDPNLRPVELGASIFVEANRHMVKAAKLFNLTIVDPDFGESGVGIWDGEEFLYITSLSKSLFSGWWDALSAAWRYGPLSPYRTSSAVGSMLKKFSNFYNPKWLIKHGAARSIEEFIDRVELGRDLTTVKGDEWALKTVGVSEKWMGEIMEGSTRVNYASDMDMIHALGASVSMATGGAKAVQGGNWRIFEAMLKNASATMHLGTTVTDIRPYLDESGERMFQIVTNISTKDIDQPFDNVFFAAPWHSSPLAKDFTLPLETDIPRQRYVRLHVTYFATTRRRPDPSFFGLPNTTTLPTTILTTGYTARQSKNRPPPRFQSITWHGETYPGSGEYTVKVFSLTYLKDSIIRSIIGGDEPTWLLRKEWDSYPPLRPISSYAPVEPVKGVQYLAALEPWISTMETQTLSGREAVARVVEEWWGLGMGECRGGADAWDWSCAKYS